ncbi:hypothetical protein IEQ34_017099 [Dendrobium chrysotoxum]|uniref:Uncharacterized protein n=1 Tax=Dendrobium chrysotoxum TaxID=161865 RepID=A0AAV7FSZ9_DENCH|nr:hypothetical protein IEQ34_017099 [Dendrobium chrysotoxum]
MVKLICKNCDDHHLLKLIENVEEVCKKMMATPIDLMKNKSLFEMARVLAHLMLVIREEDRWKVIATTWIELLKKWSKNS